MKRTMYLFMLCLTTLSATDKQSPNTDTTDEVVVAQKPGCSKQEIAQAVLAGVAHIAGNVGNIIKDPHNSHNVGGSVTNMISGLINIIAAAIKNRTIDLTNEETIKKELLIICQPMCEQITDAVVTRMRSAQNAKIRFL